MMTDVLMVNDLTVTAGQATILDGVTLSIPKGKIVGIVGGSGSGKTTLGLSILNLLPSAMKIRRGEVLFGSSDLLTLPQEDIRQVRGGKIGMVFQEPLSAFDPLFTIGSQLEETLAAHTRLNGEDRREKVLQVLTSVEIDDPKRIMASFPHQLSGGLRQRAMIAQAIICGPEVIIADEATSSLDVTIQAKIIRLLKKLNREQGMTIVFISHDLGLVGFMADDVAVMTQGRIVEYGPASQIMEDPKDNYTKELLKAY